MGAPGTELPPLGSSLVLTLVSLLAVCAIALAVLRWLGRRSIGHADPSIRVRGRCYLEPRRSVYIVETAGRCFLIGVGESAVNLIAEVDAASLASQPAEQAGTFADALAKVLRRRSR